MHDLNQVLIEIKNVDKYYMMDSLYRSNIYYVFIEEKEENKYLKISINDYKKIKVKFKSVKIIKYYGIYGLIIFFKKKLIFLFSFLWGLIILIYLSNTIFDISINTSDEDLKYKLMLDLENNGIKKYSLKKSYKELNEIKNIIIKNNSEIIEWLEIKENGTHYLIELTPRIIVKKEEKENIPRHIVASKDALIKHIVFSSGNAEKEINDYVKKGEIIINGNIIKNEETIKARVHAEGIIFGEVWYTVKVSVPYKYIEYIPTGKVINHYYFKTNNGKMTILGKYDTEYAISEKKTIIDKPYLFFKVIRERKEIYEYKEFNVTKSDAIEEAKRRSEKAIKNKLKKGEYIISKNVLKISPLSSKIELEIFYKVYENITDIALIEESEGIDSEGRIN